MTFEEINADLAKDHLQVMGIAGDVVLLGPKEPGFWLAFTGSPEWQDGQPDPIDRWSHRVISKIAVRYHAEPLFPFGPQAANFLGLALESGAAWSSPVGMLVHDNAGLMISYRGALRLDHQIERAIHQSPCPSCTRPCTKACPVGALSENGYDIPKCKTYLKTLEGADCLQNGCLARRVCPVSGAYARNPAQSGYHMRKFLESGV